MGGEEHADEVSRAPLRAPSRDLTKKDNARITTGQGANQLPTVQGPQITIAPPVTSRDEDRRRSGRSSEVELFSGIQQGGRTYPVPLFLCAIAPVRVGAVTVRSRNRQGFLSPLSPA